MYFASSRTRGLPTRYLMLIKIQSCMKNQFWFSKTIKSQVKDLELYNFIRGLNGRISGGGVE